MKDSNSFETYALRTQLPVSRVRKIVRLDSHCTTISTEAVQLLTLAAERFIGLLAKVAYGQAVFDKRRTLQQRDLEFCIKNYEPFSFLDDTLDGWPEINGGKRSLGNGSSIAMVAKMSGGFFSLDANEKQDLIVDANGLSDEVFGFDESLEGTETPYGGQIGEELDNAVIAKNTKKDVVPETQNFKLVSGHYGYYLPMNPTTTTLIQTADVEVEADITCSKQKEEEVEVIQVFDTSVISDTE